MNAPSSNQNVGHGHVFPRPDGVRARCGGPGICAECSKDAYRKDGREQPSSKEQLAAKSAELFAHLRGQGHGYVADAFESALKQIDRLEQDAVRYESGREALCIVIDTQKDKIKQLEMAERLNVQTVANFQKRIDELEQCHREGWRHAREVEDEFRKRTGRGFGDPEPPTVTPPAEATRKYLESMAALTRDADRYRWLRSHVAPSVLERITSTPKSLIVDKRPEALDVEIDIRIAGKTGAGVGPSLTKDARRQRFEDAAFSLGVMRTELPEEAKEPPDCPHCDGFEVDGTVLHGPRCPTVETEESLNTQCAACGLNHGACMC